MSDIFITGTKQYGFLYYYIIEYNITNLTLI